MSTLIKVLVIFFCDFFLWKKNLKIVTLNFDFKQFDFCFLLKFISFLLFKGKQTPLSNSKSVKITNVIDF